MYDHTLKNVHHSADSKIAPGNRLVLAILLEGTACLYSMDSAHRRQSWCGHYQKCYRNVWVGKKVRRKLKFF